MPFVQIKVIGGVFSEEEKRRMLEKVSEAMISVEGENLRAYTMVTLDEVESGNWAVGGKSLSAEEVKAIIGGKSKAA